MMTGAASIAITPMAGAHAASVLAVYQAGIGEGNATFETEALAWERFDATRMPDHRFVAVAAAAGGTVTGWTARAPVSDRYAYAGVVEHSVYVDAAHRGQRVG